MNLSKLITRIKLNLGIYTIALPIDVDSTLKKVIEDITLPVFSIYQPCRTTMNIDVKRDLTLIDKYSNYQSFLLPDFGEKELLYVEDIEYDDTALDGIGYWGGGIPMLHGNMINQLALSNAGTNLVSSMLPKITFKFEQPRTLFIYNLLSSNQVVLSMAFSHDKSLGSIPVTAEESFYQLAFLDCKQILYNTIKHYNEIETAYGRIQLKIDDWANAEQERKDLLNEWDSVYYYDGNNFVYA